MGWYFFVGGNSGIDTDDALSEKNAVNADGVEEAGNVGSEADVQGNAGAVKQDGQENVVNGENDIANSDEVGYKEEEMIDGFR